MKKKQQISQIDLILMILSTAFGFVNVSTAYDQMSYSSIIWYLLGAICFFIPTAFMFAEYGSALGNHGGGVFTWIKSGLGERWAFVGTFIWLSAWIVTMLFKLPRIWIAYSACVFGKDHTQDWNFMGLSGTQTVGILSILFLIVATAIASKGLKSITRFASIGGFLATSIVFIFCGLSIFLIFMNHGKLAQPITSYKDFLISPNPQFQSSSSLMSFILYATFAYAGIEAISGVSNHLKNPKKNFPKDILIASIIMVSLYTISIFLCGVASNWAKTFNNETINLGNVMYILMGNLGFAVGDSLGLSSTVTNLIAQSLVRFTGFATVCGLAGGFLILLYSPLQVFIFGSSKKLWPKWILHTNKHQMPEHAMWLQTTIITIILFLISFGGSTTKEFYQILVNMNNVCTGLQYVLIILAFPFFKNLSNLKRPFTIYHSKPVIWFVTLMVVAIIVLGVIFNLIQLLINKDFTNAIWTCIIPIIFGGSAWLFYNYRIKKSNR